MSTVTSTTTSTSTYTTSQSAVGIDTSALIEEAVAAKEAPADRIEVKIEENETTIAAYQDLQSLLQDLQTASQSLRNAAGSEGQADNVFNDRAAYIEGSAADAIGATIEQGAADGSYEIEVQQIAKAHKVGSTSVSDPDADLGMDGTFTLGLEDGGTASISVTSDMSINDIASAINAESETTNVTATVLKVTDGDYMLVLSGTETGKSITATADSGDDVLSAMGIATAGVFDAELQAPQDAILVFDGVTITRSSNSIDDLIDGMTLELYEAAPGETISIDVETDLSAVEDAITAFVDAYNALREFVLTNQETSSDGGASEDATLFGDQLLRSASNSVQDAMSYSVDGLSLRDIGITMNSSNILEVDTSTLEDALLTDLDTVMSLFQYQFDSSSSDLQVLRSGSAATDQSFTLDVTVAADGTLISASIDGDTSLFTVSGNTISGVDGTIYEGLKMVYTGETGSMDVTITSGIADQLWNAADILADSSDGLLASSIESLQETNEDLEEDMDFYLESAERYREFLTDKYASMEAAALEAESTLNYLLELLNTED